MNKFWRVYVTFIAACALLVWASGSAKADPYYGVGVGAELEGKADASLMNAAASTGAGGARFAVKVNADQQVQQIEQAGMTPYPTLTNGYGAFAAAHPEIHNFEIGNEPDIAGISPEADAATYREASAEILAAHPGARVVEGGLAAIWWGWTLSPWNYFTSFVHALGSCPPAVGYHTYPVTLTQLQESVLTMRAVMVADGCAATELDVNEMYADAPLIGPALTWLHSQSYVAHIFGFFWGSNMYTFGGLSHQPLMSETGTLSVEGETFENAVHGYYVQPPPAPPVVQHAVAAKVASVLAPKVEKLKPQVKVTRKTVLHRKHHKHKRRKHRRRLARKAAKLLNRKLVFRKRRR